MLKVGERVKLNKSSLFANFPEAGNPIDCEGTIQDIGKSILLPIDVLWDNNQANLYREEDLVLVINTKTKIKETIMLSMKEAVLDTAETLASVNNTFTTLELKMKLRVDYPHFYWTQDIVSLIMTELTKDNKYTYTTNGTYRVYTSPKLIKAKKIQTSKSSLKKSISRSKALDMMKGNKGRFFTVTFVKKDGTVRCLNGQYVKDQTELHLGYVLVKEAIKLKSNPKDAIRNVNLQTLTSIKIAGVTHKVK